MKKSIRILIVVAVIAVLAVAIIAGFCSTYKIGRQHFMEDRNPYTVKLRYACAWQIYEKKLLPQVDICRLFEKSHTWFWKIREMVAGFLLAKSTYEKHSKRKEGEIHISFGTLRLLCDILFHAKEHHHQIFKTIVNAKKNNLRVETNTHLIQAK